MHLLFICTHNRCRSILSEAITNHLGADRLTAGSVGQTCTNWSLRYLYRILNPSGPESSIIVAIIALTAQLPRDALKQALHQTLNQALNQEPHHGVI